MPRVVDPRKFRVFFTIAIDKIVLVDIVQVHGRNVCGCEILAGAVVFDLCYASQREHVAMRGARRHGHSGPP
jgi:hypothetical protein